MAKALSVRRLGGGGTATLAAAAAAVLLMPSVAVAAAPTDPPTSVIATVAAGSGVVTLDWDAPVGAGTIDDYNVQYFSPDAGGPGVFTNIPASANHTCDDVSSAAGPCTVSGLTPGNRYFFRVRAEDVGVDTGPWATSNEVTAIEPPNAAIAPIVTVTGDEELSIDWTAPVTTGARPASSYAVQVSSDAGANWATQCAAPAPDPCVATGLTAGTTYLFRLVATNAAGSTNSANSSGVVAITTPATPVPVATVTGAGEVELAWTPTPTAGQPVSEYVVEYREDGAVSWEAIGAGGDCETPATSPCTITGLEPGTEYEFRVTAHNDVTAPSGVSGVSAATSVAIKVPNAPEEVELTVHDDLELSVAWTAPDTESGAAPVDTYEVEVSVGGEDYAAVGAGTCSGAVAGTSCVLTGLEAEEEYQVRVRAVNDAGEGAWSEESNAQYAITLPGEPGQAFSDVNGDGQMFVNWTAPTITHSKPVDYYVVQYSVGGGAFANVPAGECDEPTEIGCTITGLTPGASYRFQVAAVNGAGIGPWSDISVPTIAVATPTNVIAVIAPTDNVGELTVDWTAPANTAPTGYLVYYSTEADGEYSLVPSGSCHPAVLAPTTICQATNLTLGTTYYFKVAAVFGVDQGEWSAPSEGMTVYGPPAAPDKPAVSLVGDRAVKLTWGPEETASAPVDNYVVTYSLEGADFTEVISGECFRPTGYECTVENLSLGGEYRFKVVAFNEWVDAPLTGVSSATSDAITVDTFVPPPPPGTAEDSSLDGDGKDEILYIDSTGTVRAFRNVNGLASFPFTEAAVTVGYGFEAGRTKVGDIDGDGKTEIIYIDSTGTVRAFKNINALTSFPYTEAAVTIGFGFDAARTWFADIDGDGMDEIVYVDGAGTVRAFRNVNGLASFPYTEAAIAIGYGFTAGSTRFADLDGDGKDEIAYVDGAGTVRAFRNVNGLASFPYTEAAMVVGNGFTAASTWFADVDGDDKAEIVYVDGSGTVRAFRNVNALASFPYTEAAVTIGYGFDASRTLFTTS